MRLTDGLYTCNLRVQQLESVVWELLDVMQSLHAILFS